MRNETLNTAKRIIYDIGSNNGDDIPYYLKKSDVVVAVEANPWLCTQIEGKYSSAISGGRLVIENVVLTTSDSPSQVAFYIHKSDHVLSQFCRPDDDIVDEFNEVSLPSKSVRQLIAEHGDPYYVKIDVENYDAVVLRELFSSGVRPPFISAESHSIEVFSLLVALGGYKAFKLVDGATVSRVYANHLISVGSALESYSFPPHSAGPFGQDITGDWMSADNFFRLLAFENLGWKDIHATTEYPPNVALTASMRVYAKKRLKRRLLERFRRLRTFFNVRR